MKMKSTQKKRSRLPSEGKFIQTANGDRGKVLKLHVFNEMFDLLTDGGRKRRYSKSQFKPDLKLPEEWKFPREFNTIFDETHDIIGQSEMTEEELAQQVIEEFGGKPVDVGPTQKAGTTDSKDPKSHEIDSKKEDSEDKKKKQHTKRNNRNRRHNRNKKSRGKNKRPS